MLKPETHEEREGSDRASLLGKGNKPTLFNLPYVDERNQSERMTLCGFGAVGAAASTFACVEYTSAIGVGQFFALLGGCGGGAIAGLGIISAAKFVAEKVYGSCIAEETNEVEPSPSSVAGMAMSK